MVGYLITSVLSLATHLLPSIRASVQAPSSSFSFLKSINSKRGCAQAFEKDLERLMRTLEWIKATLYDADEREIRDRSVKLWLKELKKVAYDAEDVLSEYLYEVNRVHLEARKASEASDSHKRKKMEYIEYIVQIPDGMVDRLNKIRSRFDEIAKDRVALQFWESDGARRPNNKLLRPPTGHMVDEANIFGRDAEIEEVINLLLSEKEKPFSVISIIGKGGLGKTTIAQLVYKDERVTKCFDLFGWVCVSEEFDVGRLTKATIESVSKINSNLSELSSLQEKLAEIVKGKKILLVLDDVWNENRSLWDSLRVPFKEAKLVRILVTTRNKMVADVMQTTTYFRPTNMPEDSCWQLFQHYAFNGTSDTMPPHLVNMGKDIMRKCGGLPLAVKSIASLLSHETNEEDWREILESDLWESNSSNDIFPALQISYDHLPPHLKPCFLVCSMYPKDYILEKMNLIELWISHGYIESKGKRKITDIGVEYYEELKQRSFVDHFVDHFFDHFIDHFSSRSKERCKLHDIIHDLARLNSENEHYSVEINQPLDIQKENVPQEACHLYVGGFSGYVDEVLQQNMMGLRTLSINMSGRYGDLDYWSCNLAKFRALRVLELEGDFLEIPGSISELKHLTHLDIKARYLQTLPLSIGLLYNLQTLILDCDGDLKYLLHPIPKWKHQTYQTLLLSIGHLYNLQTLILYCYSLEYLPESIGSLSNLRRLIIETNNTINYLPHGLVNFPAIKSMKARVIVGNVAWLKDMTDLEGNLSICGVSNLKDAQHANMRNKCKLEGFYINCDPKVDPAKSMLKLTLKPEISVHDADFSWLESLQPHPNLKKLGVGFYSSATMPGWMCDPCSLQSIQEISLNNCDKIQSLSFNNLHTLKHLVVHDCHGLRVLQLEQMSSQLEKLEIFRCRCLELITVLGNLDMLATLKIYECEGLKSITMDGLQSVKSTEPIGDFSHGKPRIGRQNISTLTRLEISLNNFDKIQSLSFKNLHTLKHLVVRYCHGFRVLQLEQMSSQLEKLEIFCCRCLELITGLGKLDMLATLKISNCGVLKSITMDGLQSVESTEPIGDSSHGKPCIGRQSISTLTRLEISLNNCDKIQSLPFNNLHTLKRLIVRNCSGFRVLQLEQLSSQLEELKISDLPCLELITGLGNLDMLATLEIYQCEVLKSITMDGLQSAESTEPIGDSSHGKPRIGRQSSSTLTRLEIKYCEFLCVLPVGWTPSIEAALTLKLRVTEPFIPYVRVLHCGCTDIEVGDLQ
ncbi:putative disease resistance protein RGA1 [Carex rostrata]